LESDLDDFGDFLIGDLLPDFIGFFFSSSQGFFSSEESEDFLESEDLLESSHDFLESSVLF